MILKQKIVRSKRSTIALKILPDASLLIKAPIFMPDIFINKFINNNSEWIEKQRLKIINQKKNKLLNFKDNGQLLFLGEKYSLIYNSGTAIELQEDKILIPQAIGFRIEKELNSWLINKARKIITKQIEYYSNLMNANYSDLKFSDTNSQWGRCTYDNKLQFSWRLVMAPIFVINYVVVHELVHTFEKNHSRSFWNKVRLYNPSYKQQIKWLRENGHSLKD